MTQSSGRPSLWTRFSRWIQSWISSLDTDPHELTAERIGLLEKRLDAVEAELRLRQSFDGDPK